MPTSSGLITAHRPERLMQRVCQHWNHRFSVTLSSHKATVDFGDSCCLFEARKESLFVTLQAPAAELPELETIVLEHLQRFALSGCQLQADWTRSAG